MLGGMLRREENGPEDRKFVVTGGRKEVTKRKIGGMLRRLAE